jgi:1-acyl-sn-glycerol-3-phosphate acyltransferase
MDLIVIKHWERFPVGQTGFIIAPNHPSLFDPFRVGSLLWPQYILNPRKYAPRCVADQTNYQKRWWWFGKIFQPIMIWVPRDGSQREQFRAFHRMARALKRKNILLIFAEGGRTGSEINPKKIFTSPGGAKLRALKPGVPRLAKATNAPIVPVWITTVRTAGWRPSWLRWQTTISIGQPIAPEQAHTLTAALLALADEVDS